MPDTPTRDTVYFYKFNNYYNRIIKRYDTIAEYTANATLLGKQENCNFVHGDGVNSNFTWNKLATDTDTPDYVVVDDYKGNISRWFVTNSFKSRDRQDKLQLRRDLIADFYSDIVQYSPCLIRKGYVPQDNPLIFNDEGVQYNKKKENEILIKDRSNCSYIVGFISNSSFATQETVHGTIKADNYDYYYSSLADFPFKNYVEGAGNTRTDSAKILTGNNDNAVYFSLKYSWRLPGEGDNYETIFNNYSNSKPSYYSSMYSNYAGIGGTYYSPYGGTFNNVVLEAIPYPGITPHTDPHASYLSTLRSKLDFSYLVEQAKRCFSIEPTDYADIMQFDGKKIKIDNIIYNVEVRSGTPSNTYVTYNAYNPTINSAFNNIITHINNNKPTTGEMSWEWNIYYYHDQNRYQPSDLRVMASFEEKYLYFTEAVQQISTVVDTPNNRTHLENTPYDMFVLINESGVSYKVGTDDFVSDHATNINIAQAICQASGTGSFDIQIVPFNPLQSTIKADDKINFYDYDVHTIKDYQNNTVGHYVWCSSAEDKLIIEKNELKLLPTNYKKDYNLKQYRLCSPNQESMFEFSPSMNYGVEKWRVSFNYRPYTSYIKVQPEWKGLYGNNEYNGKTDFRGLVYNSSLCVTQLNDAWANYVSNNKNYQQLFDNQINTLTKQQEVQLSAMEETLGLRSFTGMPIGSILRVIGGSKDIEMTRELNNIAITKMETDFKYQMDNVKSMPHTIKKLTNINEDTRVFPFIEIYSATEVEEQSFDLKMRWTGYTIMTSGVIDTYLQPGVETFIQADLIRLDLSRSEETADNHIASEIATELAKGIYLTKESE